MELVILDIKLRGNWRTMTHSKKLWNKRCAPAAQQSGLLSPRPSYHCHVDVAQREMVHSKVWCDLYCHGGDYDSIVPELGVVQDVGQANQGHILGAGRGVERGVLSFHRGAASVAWQVVEQQYNTQCWSATGYCSVIGDQARRRLHQSINQLHLSLTKSCPQNKHVSWSRQSTVWWTWIKSSYATLVWVQTGNKKCTDRHLSTDHALSQAVTEPKYFVQGSLCHLEQGLQASAHRPNSACCLLLWSVTRLVFPIPLWISGLSSYYHGRIN